MSMKIQFRKIKKLTKKKSYSNFQCLGTTKSGARCARILAKNVSYCFQHSKKSITKNSRAKTFDQFYTFIWCILILNWIRYLETGPADPKTRINIYLWNTSFLCYSWTLLSAPRHFSTFPNIAWGSKALPDVLERSDVPKHSRTFLNI